MILNLRKAAELLDIQPRTLRRWLKIYPDIPAIRKGNKYRFIEADLEAWLKGFKASELAAPPSESLSGQLDKLLGPRKRKPGLSAVTLGNGGHLQAILSGKHATRAIRECGVYVLFKGKAVVYVGQTRNFHARLGQHLEEKDFDGYYFMPVPENELLAHEADFIRHLKPTLNKTCLY